MTQMNRRAFVAAVAGVTLMPEAALALARSHYRMFHSPGCGCCLEWARRVEAALGRPLPIEEVRDMASLKRERGIPTALQSCHTALFNGLLVEGHVPPADIRRALGMPHRPFRGLAVPGMPLGSPGMDVGHDQRQPYQVIAFGPRGQSVFARHG